MERLALFVVFVIGGSDTTAHGLSYALHCLVSNPDAMAKAVEEVDSVLKNDQISPESSQVGDLLYIHMCMKEAWRMYPIAGGSAREVTEAITMGRHTFEKGVILYPFGAASHYNEKNWPNPHKYDPERFAKENEGMRPRGAYIPFSQGPRDCIGKELGRNESIVVLSSLLRRYTFAKAPDYKFVVETGFTSRPKYDIPMRVSLRKDRK